MKYIGMRRLAVSLSKLPRSSESAIGVVKAAINLGCDVLLQPSHCDGHAARILGDSIRQAGGMQPGRSVFVSIGVVEGDRKAELIARYGKNASKGLSLPAVASIDEHSANCMEPDCLEEELTSARSALPDDCPVVALLQNPEDHSVAHLNSFSATQRQQLEADGYKVSPGGVLLPTAGAAASASAGVPGQAEAQKPSLVETIRAEAYRIQPELQDKVRVAFGALESLRLAGSCSGYGVLSEGFGDPEAMSGFSHESLFGLAKQAAVDAGGAAESGLHALAMPGNPVERAALRSAGADALSRGLSVLVTRPHAGRDRSGAPVPLLPAPDASDYGAVLAQTMEHFTAPSKEEAHAAGLTDEELAEVDQACQWIRGYFESMEGQRKNYTSPSHFEYDLATYVAPTLRDKVHSMDDESAAAIARFIEAYGRRVAADSEDRVRGYFEEKKNSESVAAIRPGEALDLYSLRWLQEFGAYQSGRQDRQDAAVPVVEPMAIEDIERWVN